MSGQQEKAGLQAERTQLAWERTALGFLAGGAIPLLREGGPLSIGRTLLAVMAVALALLVIVLARARVQRVLGASPRTEVLLIGWATAGFAATIVVLLLLAW